MEQLYCRIDDIFKTILKSGAKNTLNAVDQLIYFWYLHWRSDRRDNNLPASQLSWRTLIELKEKALNMIMVEVGSFPGRKKDSHEYIMRQAIQGITLDHFQCQDVLLQFNFFQFELETMARKTRYDKSKLELDCLEHLLQQLSQDAYPAMLPTPKAVVSAISDMVAEVSSSFIHEYANAMTLYDPCCGTGALLWEAAAKLREAARIPLTVTGRDLSPAMLRISLMRFLLGNRERDGFDFQFQACNALGKNNIASLASKRFDFAVLHGPFSGTEQLSGVVIEYLEFRTDRTELLILTHACMQLRGEGFLFALIPEHVMTLDSEEYESYRSWLFSRYSLHAVITLAPALLHEHESSASCLIVLQNLVPDQGQAPNIFINDVASNEESEWRKMLFSWQNHIQMVQGNASAIAESVTTIPYDDMMREKWNASAYRRLVSGKVGGKLDKQKTMLLERMMEHLSNLESSIRKRGTLPVHKDELTEQLIYPFTHAGLASALNVPDDRLQPLLQLLIVKRKVEAAHVHGKVVYQMSETDCRFNQISERKHTHLLKHLSREQRSLFEAIVDAPRPLAIHEARRKMKVSNKDREQFSVQAAKQTIELLHRLGLVEPVYQFFDWDEREGGQLLALDLWKAVEEGNRTWKFIK